MRNPSKDLQRKCGTNEFLSFENEFLHFKNEFWCFEIEFGDFQKEIWDFENDSTTFKYKVQAGLPIHHFADLVRFPKNPVF